MKADKNDRTLRPQAVALVVSATVAIVSTLAFQNCSAPTAGSNQIVESSKNNTNGYGGKPYVRMGVCGGQDNRVSDIIVWNEESQAGSIVAANCQTLATPQAIGPDDLQVQEGGKAADGSSRSVLVFRNHIFDQQDVAVGAWSGNSTRLFCLPRPQSTAEEKVVIWIWKGSVQLKPLKEDLDDESIPYFTANRLQLLRAVHSPATVPEFKIGVDNGHGGMSVENGVETWHLKGHYVAWTAAISVKLPAPGRGSALVQSASGQTRVDTDDLRCWHHEKSAIDFTAAGDTEPGRKRIFTVPAPTPAPTATPDPSATASPAPSPTP